MRPRIFIALGALVVLSTLAHADCGLPPLNGITQKQENPVDVGGYRFGSAWYSYYVESYRIDSLHCSKTINSGPRGWDVIVESGRVIVNSEPQAGEHQTRKANERPFTNPALPALPPLPQNARPLPQPQGLAPLPDVKPLANVKPLSGAPGQLPPLPALPQP
jgi:hypothetical protein